MTRLKVEEVTSNDPEYNGHFKKPGGDALSRFRNIGKLVVPLRWYL